MRSDSGGSADWAEQIRRAKRCRDRLWEELQAEQVDGTFWVGELSSSALSTATAVAALALMDPETHAATIRRGLDWLAANRHTDGGFGDTVRSRSNLSTTFLVRSAIAIADTNDRYRAIAESCDRSINAAGGAAAVLAKYGSDRTFSVPILMMGALGGLCDWSVIPRLPFELAVLPREFYAAVRLPVVSYALPALIAIGQLLHERNPSRNPVSRSLRGWSQERTLVKLESLQPSNGGFLEATPLTSFVTMALAAMGRQDNVVAARGTQFIKASQRHDGSWPIDTNLSTWVTTLTVNAWGYDARERLPQPDATLDWLLDQQYDREHAFTGAAPGGWAWTPLPGGVPDADDTAGAVLAIRHLRGDRVVSAQVDAGQDWLRSLRNRDGGTPTFCRGWGTLPFDASTPELTAHHNQTSSHAGVGLCPKSLRYLERQQRDGLWAPLWFGNEKADRGVNWCYGTGRVLQSRLPSDCEERALDALARLSPDGVPKNPGAEPVLEEVAVVLHGIACSRPDAPLLDSSLRWLCDRIDEDAHRAAAPIGLYFANLWYFEKLYPVVFSLAALNQVLRVRRHRDLTSGTR